VMPAVWLCQLHHCFLRADLLDVGVTAVSNCEFRLQILNCLCLQVLQLVQTSGAHIHRRSADGLQTVCRRSADGLQTVCALITTTRCAVVCCRGGGQRDCIDALHSPAETCVLQVTELLP